LVDWSIGRLVDWSIGRLVDWSIGRLVDWSIGRLVDWSIGRLIDRALLGNCDLLDALRQTPIVFSGESGAGSEIYDITVRESAAAVAVLGGDDLIYRSYGTTNANGLIIHKVSFE
jgi:hypothetical protein